ncbi:MAG: A24 family peptidase [Candidatus Pacearchaeota archaeon]
MLQIADIIVSVIATIWLVAACVTDIKKREVADWLSFSLIAIALAIKLMASLLSSNYYYFLYALLGLGIFTSIAFAFYYSRIFGGGDAKLLIALSACFSSRPSFATKTLILGFEPFLLVFMINLLFLGSIYGLLFSTILALKNRKKFSYAYKKIEKDYRKYKIFYFALALFSFFLAIATKVYNLVILALILVALPYLFSFVKASERLMLKLKSWHELAEGDWLAKEVKIKNKIIKPSVDGLTKKDIQEIKKANKKVLIQDGIPFVPVFLLALLTSLFLGNLLLLLIT